MSATHCPSRLAKPAGSNQYRFARVTACVRGGLVAALAALLLDCVRRLESWGERQRSRCARAACRCDRDRRPDRHVLAASNRMVLCVPVTTAIAVFFMHGRVAAN
jgi:hypothetical protein